MQAKAEQGVVETLLDGMETQVPPAVAEKLDHLVRLAEETLNLQHFAALGPNHVLDFHVGGVTTIKLALPDALDDYIQRVIMRRRGFYEGKLLNHIRSLNLIGPETTVCDIGANIGNHSVFFGKVLKAKNVLAFEPLPRSYDTLCRNLDLNGLSNAMAYHCLVGAKSGRGDVSRFNPRNLGATQFQPAKNGSIPMVALDDLIEAEEMQGLSFIKIDVEGMQLDVLNGAKKLIKAFRPAIWVEIIDRDDALAQTMKLMDSLGYVSAPLGGTNYLFTFKK